MTTCEAPFTADHVNMTHEPIPLKRVGAPEEVAGLVAYLVSKESGYMTGASLTINGCMSV